MRSSSYLILALFSGAFHAAGASASVGPSSLGALADTSRVVDLDEVVVVSQPKENFRLRRQPVAATVFTDSMMQGLGISSLSRLSAFVPSFAVPDYGARYTSSIYVRGIGSRIGDPAVGMYVDNVPLVNKSTYNRHLYMIDRVDVLRGPQGTLYGLNAEGGIVRMYTKDPMNYQGTDLRAGIGSGLAATVEVAHYHRPTEAFAFSAAAFYNGQRGFFDNSNLGTHADLSNEAGGRMRFVWRGGGRLSADLTADYQYVNQNAFAYGEYDAASGSISDPSTTFDNGYRRQMASAGLNLAYRLPGLLVSSATGYQYLYDFMQMDQDYLPADYMRLEQRQKLNVLTQELSLRSLGSGRWRHASGVFFSYQWLHTYAPVSFGGAMNELIVSQMGMPSMVASAMSLTENWVPGWFDTPQLNLGLYHESNVSLSDRLVLTLGLRYDHQRASIDYDSYSTFRLWLDMPQMQVQGNRFESAVRGGTSESYNQLLPKVALTYTVGDSGSNVYAVASKGFRAGGYNLQMFSDIFRSEQSSLGMKLMGLMQGDMTVEHSAEEYENINKTITYKPEETWNYELGAHLNLFGGKVQADVSAYYMRVDNQQLSVMAGNYGYGRMMVNAGKSSSAGFEVALRGRAAAGRLAWSATYSFTSSTFSQYTDSVEAADGNGKVLCDYGGNHVPFVPIHTFSAMADYRFPTPGAGSLRAVTLGADVSGNGRTYWDAAESSSQKFYALLGAHAAFDFGSLKLNLWGRNLTCTSYNTFLVSSSVDGVERSFAQRGTPLQVGIDMMLHF